MTEKETTSAMSGPGGRPLTKAEQQRIDERRRIERRLRAARRFPWARHDPAEHSRSGTVPDEAEGLTPAQRQRIEERKRIEKLGRESRLLHRIAHGRKDREPLEPQVAPGEAETEPNPSPSEPARLESKRPSPTPSRTQREAEETSSQTETLTPAQRQRIDERHHIEKVARQTRRHRFGFRGRKQAPLSREQRRALLKGAAVAAAILILIGFSIASVLERRSLRHEILSLRDQTLTASTQADEALTSVQTSLQQFEETQGTQAETVAASLSGLEAGFSRIEDRLVALTSLAQEIRDLSATDAVRSPETASDSIPLGAFQERDASVTLPDGSAVRALFTLPAEGSGPFPAVLLIPGIEAPNLDGLTAASDGASPGPLKQVAEVLAGHGYAVLRFDLRTAGSEQTLITAASKADLAVASAALATLLDEPEARKSGVTLLAFGWSTALAVHLARDRQDIANLVLLSPIAEELTPEWVTDEAVYRGVYFAATALDANADGRLSIAEVTDWIAIRSADQLTALSLDYFDPTELLASQTGGETSWTSGIDVNGDGDLGISDELTAALATMDQSQQGSYVVSESLGVPLTWIGDVHSSILILASEGDSNSPATQARMLAQKLAQAFHPDVTLGVYDGLGGGFQTIEQIWWRVPGPIADRVLTDLANWLDTRSKSA
jgi:pimeloyl-ACP methyl ester carboxylesterase